MLLVNFRPEFRADWTQRSWYRQIALAPLGPEAVQELLDDLLGKDESISGLGARIHERTGGNPFFTEEVVQGLIESGQLEGQRGAYRLLEPIARLEIPSSVNSLLASRIDRLGEREKHVLQAAAVLGKTFEEPLLEVIVDLPKSDLRSALDALKQGEFLYEQSLYPVAEYAFKHPLTQEVALGSQLGDRRRKLHAAAAEALEEKLADRLDENSALLAHHWEEADRPRAAARWQRRAALWISGRDSVQSIRHWQRVRDLTAGLDEDEESQHLALEACTAIAMMGGWRLGLDHDAMAEITDQGRALAERFDDRDSLVRIIAADAASEGTAGDTQAYLEGALEAERLVDDSLDLESRVISKVNRAYSLLCVGRFAEALPEIDAVGRLAGPDLTVGFEGFGYSATVWRDHLSAIALAYLGRFEEADAQVLKALRRARDNDLKENLGWALGSVCQVAWIRGGTAPGMPELRAAALESMRIAEEISSPYSLAFSHFSLAEAEVISGDFEESARSASEAIRLMRQEGTAQEYEAAAFCIGAQANLALGDSASAEGSAREALALASSQPSITYGAVACSVLAQSLLANHGIAARDEIENALIRAFAWIDESGSEALRPLALEARAALANVLGDQSACDRDLEEALRLRADMGMSPPTVAK
jgi:adenylate cyclase